LAEDRKRQAAERKAREREERKQALEEKRRREREEAAAERKRKQQEAAKKAAAAKSDDFEAYQRLYRQVGQLLDRAGLSPSHSLVRNYLDINYQSGIMNASLRSKYIRRLKGIRAQVRKHSR
jgi:hypothetical protein